MSEEIKEKRGSTGLAVKAGLWYVISTFLVKGLSFITTPIFSRLLSKEAYGEFSNFASWQVLLLIITAIGVGVCVYLLVNKAKGKPLLFWSLTMILGGAIGNMIDRIFRGGAVVDYLDVQLFDFAVFNFAAICVCVGTALLFVYILFFMDKEPKPQDTAVFEEEAEHDEA